MNTVLGSDNRHMHQFLRSSRRWSSQLAPLDEEKDEEARPPSRTLRSPVESDEDEENQLLQQQSAAVSTMKHDAAVAPSERSTRRQSSGSKRVSHRQPLRMLRGVDHRASAELRGGRLSMATLNERKQRKLVALFYWRRRSLETYFNTWRTVVASRKRQYELDLLRASGYAVSPSMQQPYRQSMGAHSSIYPPSRRYSLASSPQVGSPQSTSDHRERLRSLREEYRMLKTVDQPPSGPETLPVVNDVAERSQFKANLRVYYQCFEAWRCCVQHNKQCRDEAMARASRYHSTSVLQRCFRAWAVQFIKMRRRDRAQCERADQWRRQTWALRYFGMWRRWSHKQRVICQSSEVLQLTKARRAVSTWRSWVKRRESLKWVPVQYQSRVTRRYFDRIRAYKTIAQAKKRHGQSATTTWHRNLTQRVLRWWKEGVFNEELALSTEHHRRVLTFKMAVSRWKRFTGRKRAHRERLLNADLVLYAGTLRRFLRIWQAYVVMRHSNRGVYDQAAQHYSSQRCRQVLRRLLLNRCERRFHTDQKNGAAAFYDQQLSQRVLLAWQSEVSYQRRALDFRCSRARRSAVLCFVAWKQQTRWTRRLIDRAKVVDEGHCRSLLHRALGEWRATWRMTAAFRVVQATHSHNIRLPYIQAWRDVMIQRRTQRLRVTEATAKHRRQVQRVVISAWLQVAVSRRCRRRLVRLYAKKRSYKNLRNCIRTLRRHAKTLQLQRRIQERCVSGAWQSWVVHTADQQRKCDAMRAATQFYVWRRWERAVHVWQTNVRQSAATRHDTSKAIGYFIHTTMYKTLLSWAEAVHVQRQYRALVQDFQTTTSRRLVQSSFHRWRRAAGQRVIYRQSFHRLVTRAHLRRRQLAFFAWREYWKHKLEAKRRLTQAISRYRRRVGRRVFEAWRGRCLQQRQRRTAFKCIAFKRHKRYLHQCFAHWCESSKTMKSKRLDIERATAFHHEFLLLTVLYGWQHVADAQQLTRAKQVRASEAIHHRRLGQALRMWQARRKEVSMSKRTLLHASTHHQDRRRKKAVAMWRSLVKSRVEQRGAGTRAAVFFHAKLRRHCFLSWMAFTATTRAFKVRLRTVFQTGDIDIQRRAFRSWRRYKRSSTLDHRADKWRWCCLVKKVWRGWRSQVQFTHKMKSHVLVTHRLLQSNSMRGSFTQWKRYTSDRQLKRSKIQSSDRHYTNRSCRLALRRMRVAVRHAQAVELSVSFHARHLLRQQFNAWRRGVQQFKRKKENIKTAVGRYRRYQQHRAFTGWKYLVEVKQSALAAKAEACHSKTVLGHAWAVWTRVISLRRLVDSCRSQRAHRITRGAFTQWLEFRSEQQQVRRLVDAAVAHVDRVVMAKFWTRWLQFNHKRHESQTRNETARLFYGSRILQRRCFSSWRRYVHECRRGGTLQLQATVFCITTRLRQVFDRLEAYVAHRRQRSQCKQDEDRQTHRLRLARAVQRWRTRAVKLKAQTRSHSQAVQWFTHKRLMEGLQHLEATAQLRKTVRTHTARADSWYKHQQLSQLLTRWRGFVSWRRRHKHVIRLFRTNQQSDFFAMWREYVAHRRRKREAEARAVQAYRTQSQARVMVHWQSRSQYWRSKRTAAAWFIQRMLRRNFALWVQRVQLLKKMRRLFRSQEACRLQVHFQSWKLRYLGKRHQVSRLRDAMVWLSAHRQQKCFELWKEWRWRRQQERHTVAMAVGFRRRFFSLKYLMAWHGVAAWRRRKRILLTEAVAHDHRVLYQRCFTSMKMYAATKQAVRCIQMEISTSLATRKVRRAVKQWKLVVIDRRDGIGQQQRARLHHHRQLQLKAWRRAMVWWQVKKHRKRLQQRATARHHEAVSGRVLKAWRGYVVRLHKLRLGLQRFKASYFRSVADECFFQWVAFVTFKRRLRRLKHKHELAQQRRPLIVWRSHTQAKLARLRVAELIARRRRRAILSQCVAKWEEVTTDSWMYRVMVAAQRRRHERQSLQRLLQCWHEGARQAARRRRWRERSRQRQAAVLGAMLRHWAAVTFT